MKHEQAETILTAEQHQRYVAARQKAGMDCITDYDRWDDAHHALAELNDAISTAWEDSEYNPENYKDFAQFDEDSQRQKILEGKKAYWQACEFLEQDIQRLEALLFNPNNPNSLTNDLS